MVSELVSGAALVCLVFAELMLGLWILLQFAVYRHDLKCTGNRRNKDAESSGNDGRLAKNDDA